MKKALWIPLFIISFLVPKASLGSHEAKIFDQNCSGCHSIGGGKLVGPDLKGVTDRRTREWLISFIQSPKKMIDQGDATAKELLSQFSGVMMPDFKLPPTEIGALLDFIKGGEERGSPVAGGVKEASQASVEEIEKGRSLFLGKIRFASGAPACLSCHRVRDEGPLGGGGTLGPDLSQVYSKYGDSGLAASLQRPAFRVMKEIYDAQPLSEEEVSLLKAFLYSADREMTEGGDPQKKFIFLGVGGTVFLLGVTDLIWRKRRRKCIKPWVARSEETS